MARYLRIASVGLALAASSYAAGDDLPFGAAALRHLTEESEAIVLATDPRRTAADVASANDPSRVSYAVFSVNIKEVLKGDIPVASKIRVAVLEGFNVIKVNQLENAILFLRQLSARDVQQSNIPPGSDVYLVISGRYGVVDAAPPNRREAVQDYIETTRVVIGRGERVLTWTERHFGSPDPFLQRSAIIDLYYERSRTGALEQLGNAVRSEAVLPSSKTTAIQALEASGSPEAARPLREIAEDEKVQKRLRETAVKAFQGVPGGDQQLRQWSVGGDQILAPAAQSAIRGLQERSR
jgi:hypothetical protein